MNVMSPARADYVPALVLNRLCVYRLLHDRLRIPKLHDHVMDFLCGRVWFP